MCILIRQQKATLSSLTFITGKQWVPSNVSCQAQLFFSLYSVITFTEISSYCTLTKISAFDFLPVSAFLGVWSSQIYANTCILVLCDFDKANLYGFFSWCIIIKYHIKKKVEYQPFSIIQLFLMENYVPQK